MVMPSEAELNPRCVQLGPGRQEPAYPSGHEAAGKVQEKSRPRSNAGRIRAVTTALYALCTSYPDTVWPSGLR